jgi:hypothetical protein
VVACKDDVGPTILAYVWHGGSVRRMGGMTASCKNCISPSILTYGWQVGRVQEFYKYIPFGVMISWRSVCKNGISPSILAY